VVTGSVDDIRPYLAHATAAVLPLRVARGIQNKALEAMAMEKTVIATTNALQGIKICPGFKPEIADDEQSLFEAAVKTLERPEENHGAGRACILENYNWDTNLKEIEKLL
jgi:glycosyltransferase involved in cell wall biosynthesis